MHRFDVICRSRHDYPAPRAPFSVLPRHDRQPGKPCPLSHKVYNPMALRWLFSITLFLTACTILLTVHQPSRLLAPMSAAKTCAVPATKTIHFEMVGTHTVKRKPQLCRLSFRVTHEADSAEEATDKVTKTATELADRLRELAPPKSDTVKELAADEDDEDIVAAAEWPVKFPQFPVTIWSMQSIHTYNYIEHVTIQHEDGRQTTSQEGKRRHSATINLEATFHNFDALAVFTTLITVSSVWCWADCAPRPPLLPLILGFGASADNPGKQARPGRWNELARFGEDARQPPDACAPGGAARRHSPGQGLL